MAIPGIGSTGSGQQGAQASSVGATSQQLVSEQAFLQLLITELKNQDPLSPQDPTQMVAQLASFSSLEQMTQLNTNTQAMLENSATGLLGQTVTVADPSQQSGFTTGQVTGIVYFSNTPAVQINGVNYPLSAIQNIGTNVTANAPTY